MGNFHLKSIDIDKGAYKKATGESRFYCGHFRFKPGMNLLFGGNGQGKSSLLEFVSAFGGKSFEGEKLKKYCKVGHSGEPFIIYSFSNSKNNKRFARDVSDEFSFARMWDAKQQSEGQTVMQTVCDFLYALDHAECNTNAVVLIDEIDSGLDACACRYLIRRLKKVMKQHLNMQFVLAFNQYEMSKLDRQWINVCTGEIEDCPKSYDEYITRLKEIKKTFKRSKDKYVRE